VHVIDKHEKKNYSCENILNKGPRKMIWLFLVPFSFLEVVLNGTTQGYFHPKMLANNFGVHSHLV
jgi:hypothetical protein